MADDVIAAIATPPGRGGIGIVRISGPALNKMLRSVVGREVVPRHATRAAFRDGAGEIIDQGLVLFFPAPHSYTGEDVIELHGHGGPVVLRILLQRCVELGARIAAPGEFTQRAFLNDKLDLAQAEGVADLIDAATGQAARCAMRSLQGEFSQRINELVQALIGLRVVVEASLDFPEEEGVTQPYGIVARLENLRERLAAISEASRKGSLLREGARVVIAGAPNVGKSSLLNRLAGSERAIVTDIPGTTRDAIRETVAIDGVPFHFVDTAGLRESSDAVEKIGIARARMEIEEADLVLWVVDATRDESQALKVSNAQLTVINKIDMVATQKTATTPGAVRVSAKTGAGMEELQTAMLKAVGFSTSGEGLFMARERHLQALHRADSHLTAATAHVTELDLFAEELKLAQQALGAITGEFTADDLLGEIFSRFCIGK